eukprot:NODE_259_length_11524_cov_0.251028.p9 type:complete len:116 gc:universal NODE_259_length_11524_cov_0.251028:6564-6911(+)
MTTRINSASLEDVTKEILFPLAPLPALIPVKRPYSEEEKENQPKATPKTKKSKKQDKPRKIWDPDEERLLLQLLATEGGRLKKAKSHSDKVKFENYLVQKFKCSKFEQVNHIMWQ